MRLPIVLTLDARHEYDEAHAYYRAARKGLAPRFRMSVNRCLKSIQRFPIARRIAYPPDVRSVLVQGFPYIVVYRVSASSIRVISVFHTSRDPSTWQRRADDDQMNSN